MKKAIEIGLIIQLILVLSLVVIFLISPYIKTKMLDNIAHILFISELLGWGILAHLSLRNQKQRE